MKVASLKAGRDGRLVVVSDDMSWCVDASSIAPSLQSALDGWDVVEPQLRELADRLMLNALYKEHFDVLLADAPLPRAYQ